MDTAHRIEKKKIIDKLRKIKKMWMEQASGKMTGFPSLTPDQLSEE